MCKTDAKEGQYVVMTDIPGAFLHAGVEQDVHILLEGTISKLIVKLEPSLYRRFVWKTHTQETHATCETREGPL